MRQLVTYYLAWHLWTCVCIIVIALYLYLLLVQCGLVWPSLASFPEATQEEGRRRCVNKCTFVRTFCVTSRACMLVFSGENTGLNTIMMKIIIVLGWEETVWNSISQIVGTPLQFLVLLLVCSNIANMPQDGESLHSWMKTLELHCFRCPPPSSFFPMSTFWRSFSGKLSKVAHFCKETPHPHYKEYKTAMKTMFMPPIQIPEWD